MSEMATVFSDASYCKEELLRIRETWGNKTTFTEKTVEAIRKTLAWMYLYCPVELQSTVESHMNELSTREAYLLVP